MAKPTYTYQVIYSTGNTPDLTQVNVEAQNGWELDQILVNRPEWCYVMRKVAPSKKKKKK